MLPRPTRHIGISGISNAKQTVTLTTSEHEFVSFYNRGFQTAFSSGKGFLFCITFKFNKNLECVVGPLHVPLALKSLETPFYNA